MSENYFDVIIVGAGLSGIGMAYRLQKECPNKSYTILEGRDTLGGTWDLFRYPGIRSDSDMHTLGYNFKPWRDGKAIADGPNILSYIKEAATENSIDKHIRYGHLVQKANWSSTDSKWTVEAKLKGKDTSVQLSCNFLVMCSGYYSYEGGHDPDFKGREVFKGQIIHPQKWPEKLEYKNKKVVVIGSGATAVTIVPAIAKDVAHITMLQRSPTYIISRPDKDIIANFLNKILPQKTAYAITRWKNITQQRFYYYQARSRPEKIKEFFIKMIRKQLGPDYDVDTHFSPNYKPWDQRVCLVPNGDLFKAIKSKKASVVTDTIDTFTETGILLKSGKELEADIIITATGLNVVSLGNTQFSVDEKLVDFSKTYTYKGGIMFSTVPNMILTFGYLNASWTLRADLISEYACRLFNYMDEHGFSQCTPLLREKDKNMKTLAWTENFSSGYLQRVIDKLPKQGSHEPWINSQSYSYEKKVITKSPIADDALVFVKSKDAVSNCES